MTTEDAVLAGIPGTSLWGLKARAEEHTRPDGLFKDDLAVSWFKRLEPYFGGPLAEWYTPVLQQAIALRTDILDQAVSAHLAAYPQASILELGAGFSTRYSRLQAQLQPAQAWYELDLPEVMELRAAMGEPAAANHWYLADSIFSESWPKALQNRETRQILLIAEGLLMYFPITRVESLFDLLKQFFVGAQIAFDVMGSWNVSAAHEPGQEVDAPIHWGLRSIQEACSRFGLEAAGDLTLPTRLKLEPRYRKRLRPLQRWILSQRWLTSRQGGTLLARIPAA